MAQQLLTYLVSIVPTQINQTEVIIRTHPGVVTNLWSAAIPVWHLPWNQRQSKCGSQPVIKDPHWSVTSHCCQGVKFYIEFLYRTLPCTKHRTLPCTEHCTLPFAEHWTLPCSEHWTLPCSEHWTLPCSEHCTLPCTKCCLVRNTEQWTLPCTEQYELH